MSNNFKNTIRDRYKGRGNCWVKVPQESVVYNEVVEIANTSDGSEYMQHIEREGFAWIRFSKPAGNENKPQVLFEVRKRGSKIDHPDCVITVADDIAKTLPLLGNTPVKLQIEVDPANRKQAKQDNMPKRRKNNSTSSNGEKESMINDEELSSVTEIVREAKLTTSTSAELREWEKFLELEGLLDYTY